MYTKVTTKAAMLEAAKRFSTFSTLARVAVFQASTHPILISNETGKIEDAEWIRGPDGDYKVLGRIGQNHARLFESMFAATTKIQPLPGGGWNMLVDPAAVRRAFGHGYDVFTILRLRDELALARIEVKTRKLHAIGALIEVIDQKEANATKLPHGINRFTGGPRDYWFVRTGAALSALLERDYCLHVDTPLISMLRFGVSQAIARHLLTQARDQQPAGGWKLDNLIMKLAPDTSATSLRHRRHEARADTGGLAALGILIDRPKAGDSERGRGHRASGRLRLADGSPEDQKRVADAKRAAAPTENVHATPDSVQATPDLRARNAR